MSVLTGRRLAVSSREVVADLETPISIFQKLAPAGPCFLLESAEGGDRVGRFSFIGLDPLGVAVFRRGSLTVYERPAGGWPQEAWWVERLTGDPFSTLRSWLYSFELPAAALAGEDAPPLLHGGVVGYWAYDCIRYLERLPGPPPDDLKLPEAVFLFPGTILALDHLRHALRVTALEREVGPEGRVAGAAARVEAVLARLAAGGTDTPGVRVPAGAGGGSGAGGPGAGAPVSTVANIRREAFCAAVEQAREYIRAGDIFQVVLSQRLERPMAVDPFQVYRVLRHLNPSPYLFYLSFQGVPGCGDLRLVGSSPEMLVRVRGGVVETRPIAGTRPRGRTPEEDARLESELLRDEKERAEHMMLVDLGRNDVGRVAAPGSVQVSELLTVERYSHVMHLVSGVRGRLAPGRDAFDALAACFPAGTVSGAPKVRAMEIIDALEPTARGPYAGAVGYADLAGNLDTCIAIRTLVAVGGRAFVQAGAGIVADSAPEREYEESWNKARALLRAIDRAEGRTG